MFVFKLRSIKKLAASACKACTRWYMFSVAHKRAASDVYYTALYYYAVHFPLIRVKSEIKELLLLDYYF